MITETPQHPMRRHDVVVRSTAAGHRLEAHDAVSVVNDTALAIWQVCDGRTTTAEMVLALCSLFAVTPEKAAQDVDQAIRGFAAAGLLEETPQR